MGFTVLNEEALISIELYEHNILPLVSDDSCSPYLDECIILDLVDALGLQMILRQWRNAQC